MVATIGFMVVSAVVERARGPRTILVDNCEYLVLRGAITHKGNCTNIWHRQQL